MQCGCCTTVSSKNQGSRCEHGIGSRTCESFPPHSPDVISRHISEVELQEPVVSAGLISRKTACLAGPGHSCLFFRCSTLNVPPPQIPTWEAPSPRDGIWEWGLWEVSGSRGWSLMNRMSALCTEGTPPRMPQSLPLCGGSERRHPATSQKPGPRQARHLPGLIHPGRPPSRTVRRKHCFKATRWMVFLFQQPEWTNTMTLEDTQNSQVSG